MPASKPSRASRPAPRARSPRRLALFFAVGAGALGLFILGVLAGGGSREPNAPDAPTRRGSGHAPAPVKLTVESNLPVRVTVRHPEREGLAESSTELGESVRDADGAHAGDTVVLSNRVNGLHYETTLPEGVEEVHVVKEFKMGHVHFRGVPPDDRGLYVYLNDLQVAPYAAGVKIDLVEGPHTLELRGPALPQPLLMKVTVKPGETVEVDPPSALLQMPAPR